MSRRAIRDRTVSRKPLAARAAGPVGRDDVLAELRRVVDEAVAGRGHLLLLAGEAGIGKTTMLTAAAGRLPAGAVAVVGSYRDVDPVPGPALASLAARTTVLPLTGLSPDAVTRLVADVVGDQLAAEVAAGVHRRTGGNPFFVQQVSWLLRSGQDGIPPGVHEALELRFEALPGATAAALRTAAAIGQRFTADLVARASGQRPEAVTKALSAAVRTRVLSRDPPDAYRFAHDLFREYAYEQLPLAERAGLHQRIGQALEASRADGGDVPLTELARHFVQADPVSAPSWEYSVA